MKVNLCITYLRRRSYDGRGALIYCTYWLGMRFSFPSHVADQPLVDDAFHQPAALRETPVDQRRLRDGPLFHPSRFRIVEIPNGRK